MAIRGTNIFALLEDESDNLPEPEETSREPVQQEKPASKNLEPSKLVEEAKAGKAKPKDNKTKGKGEKTEEAKLTQPKIQEPLSKRPVPEEAKPNKPKGKGRDIEEEKPNKPKSHGKSGENTEAGETKVIDLKPKEEEHAKIAVNPEEKSTKSIPQPKDLGISSSAKPAHPIATSSTNAPATEQLETNLWEAPSSSVPQAPQIRKTSSIHSDPKDQGEKSRRPKKVQDRKIEERISEAEIAKEAESFKTYQEFLGQTVTTSKPKSDSRLGFIRYEDIPEISSEAYRGGRGRGYRRAGRRGGRGPAMGRGLYEGQREGNAVAPAKKTVPDVMDPLSFPKLG